MRKIIFTLFVLTGQFLAQNFELPLFTATSEATSRLAAAIPTNDILMIQENPAYGGIFAKETNFSYIRSYENSSPFYSPLQANFYGLFAGFNFKAISILPLSISFSKMRNYYNYGEITYSSSPGEYITETQYSYADIFSFSVSIGTTIKASAGITKKSFFYNSGVPDRDKEYKGWDYGALFIVPFHQLFKGFNIYAQNNLGINLGITYMLGASIRNSGDKMYINDSRSASSYQVMRKEFNIGHSLTISSILSLPERELKLLSATLGTEAHDVLTKRQNNNPEYVSAPGKFIFFDNFIFGQGSPEISASKGYILSFFETISIMEGSETGGQFENYSSDYWSNGNGFIFESAGIFKVADMLLKNRITETLANHINFIYYYSENNRGELNFRTMNYFQLEVKNITSLF